MSKLAVRGAAPVSEPPVDLVESLVLHQLGRPRNLLKVQAINVFGNRHRVNVYQRTDSGPMVTDSFFVAVEDFEIVSSDPAIELKY